VMPPHTDNTRYCLGFGVDIYEADILSCYPLHGLNEYSQQQHTFRNVRAGEYIGFAELMRGDETHRATYSFSVRGYKSQ